MTVACSDGVVTNSFDGCAAKKTLELTLNPKNCDDYDKELKTYDDASDAVKKTLDAPFCVEGSKPDALSAAFLTATVEKTPKTPEVTPTAVDKPVQATVV